MDLFLLLKAFAIGGGLCLAGQLLIDLTKLTPARILVGYVVTGVILTGAGIYAPLVEFAGAGATVPLTGFGYALAQGTGEAVAEKGWTGALAGGLTGTAAGIALTVLLAFAAALLTKPRDKA